MHARQENNFLFPCQAHPLSVNGVANHLAPHLDFLEPISIQERKKKRHKRMEKEEDDERNNSFPHSPPSILHFPSTTQ